MHVGKYALKCIIKNFYLSRYDPLNVGLKTGLCDVSMVVRVYMDGVIREVKFGCLGKGCSC